MQVIETIADLRKALDSERAGGRTVGLVPTMGYLHDGHTSLMVRAATECDVVAATIFVNPLQFGPSEDLSAYPRDIEGDTARAAAAGVQYLFTPSDTEMYPEPVLTSVSVAGMSEGMEGASRPTHFSGVATVVAKLFNITGPCRAYFGEKDHQQLRVIRKMVADLSFPVDVVACPTVRETDGLAMSSRNAYLSDADRAAAPVLYRALQRGAELVRAGVCDVVTVEHAMAAVVDAEPLADLDYAVAVAGDREWRLYTAARVGRARLIDNIGVEVPR